MDEKLCRTLALGSLVRGYFHNLRGTIQNLSLQLQLLHMKRDQLLAPPAQGFVEKALTFLQRLQDQIEIALADINNEDTGPWDLREIMEKELIFWEANLFFKHKVKKELLEKRKVLLELPLNELRGVLCLLGEHLYSAFKEGAQVRILIGEPERGLTFETDLSLEEGSLAQLSSLIPHFTPYAELSVSPERITLLFKV